jgi:hypothetical protein
MHLPGTEPWLQRGGRRLPKRVRWEEKATIRAAQAARVLILRTLARWYARNSLLEGRAQPLEDVAAALRELIPKEHPVVRPRHVARHGYLAPPISPTAAMV